MEWLDLSRLVVALVVLVAASYSDWRTRLASDLYWLFMGGVGLLLIVLEIVIAEVDSSYLLFLLPLGIVFFDIFWERKGIIEDGLNILPLALYVVVGVTLAYLFINLSDETLFWQMTDVLIRFVIIILLYQLDIIKGGADAKALIALSVMFPVYPMIAPLPLIPVSSELFMLIFPFSLLVLFNAAILSLVVPLGLFFYNLAKGDLKLPAMLMGYRIDIGEAKRKFVWPMERVQNGKLRFVYFPSEDKGSQNTLEELEALGVKRIWATPKVPFLIFITAGVVMSAIVGNLVLAFID